MSFDRRLKKLVSLIPMAANSIIIKGSTGDETTLAVGASSIVGRKASGDIVALTGAEAGVIIGEIAAANAGAINVPLALSSVADIKVAMPACTVTGFHCVVDGTTDTAAETITPSNETGDMANGDIVIASGAVDGEVDSSVPTTNNTFAAGEVLTLTTDGANGQAVGVRITVLFDFA